MIGYHREMILSNWRINVRLNTIRIPNQNEAQ